MKKENSPKEVEQKKEQNSFIYAMILVVCIFLGLIIAILKLIGIF